MNQQQVKGIPPFDRKTDHKLATGMTCSLFMPLMYTVFSNYMLPWVKYLWIPLAAIVVILLYMLGRGMQAWWAKQIGFEKKAEWDKTLWEHIQWKKSVVPFLISLTIGVGMFFIAYGLRQWYYAVTDHETIAHAKGYVYEIFAGGCGFLLTYCPALLWFLPDERVFPFDALVLRYVSPLVMLVLPTVLFGASVWIMLLYVIFYFVLVYIRGYKIKQYERLVKCVKREAEEAARRSRYQFD